MEFTLHLDCDTAAFEDDPTREIARILARLADGLHHAGRIKPGDAWKLRDADGNTVGLAELVHSID